VDSDGGRGNSGRSVGIEAGTVEIEGRMVDVGGATVDVEEGTIDTPGWSVEIGEGTVDVEVVITVPVVVEGRSVDEDARAHEDCWSDLNVFFSIGKIGLQEIKIKQKRLIQH
jgi:hypothetical protein